MTEEIETKNIGNQDDMIDSKSSIINALKSGIATTVDRVYINSLGKEYDFREVSVLEQKTLSRIMVDNNAKNRKDVVFEAQCNLINQIALDKSFNIFDLKEFDRLKLMICIYQSNMFKNTNTFKCPECGVENAYRVDFDAALKKMDAIDISDKEMDYENRHFKYHFKMSYPTVKKILRFYREYSKKYTGASKSETRMLNETTNMEYVNMYVTAFDFENKTTGEKKTVNLDSFSIADAEEILNVLPQDVLYDESGVLTYALNNFIKNINDCFEKHACTSCGTIYEDVTGMSQDFL